jgi:hypothetical protein
MEDKLSKMSEEEDEEGGRRERCSWRIGGAI